MKPGILPKRGMTKAEVAWILGVSAPTVKRLIEEKRLRAVQFSETSIRVLPDDLEAFIRAHETTPKNTSLALLR